VPANLPDADACPLSQNINFFHDGVGFTNVNVKATNAIFEPLSKRQVLTARLAAKRIIQEALATTAEADRLAAEILSAAWLILLGHERRCGE
jgi:hypothetical protein